MAKVAIMGHGVVGSGVAELLLEHASTIEKRADERLEIKYILDLRSFDTLSYADKFVTEFAPIVNDPEVTIVAEVMGGLHPAYEYVSQCLAANAFSQISGILNGTTNFILTKMIREQMSFEDALALAQQLGYAERNPAADIEGLDACRKICILASIAFGKHIYPTSVRTEGITRVTLADVEYAADADHVIKLLGRANQSDDGRVCAMVAPFLVPRTCPLSVVDDVFNAIMVTGDATGDVLFYGKGAGKLPTASAVVADMIDCAKHPEGGSYPAWADGTAEDTVDARQSVYARYIRVAATEVQAHSVFGNIQLLHRAAMPAGEVAFITDPMDDSALERAVELLRQQNGQLLSHIRVAAF